MHPLIGSGTTERGRDSPLGGRFKSAISTPAWAFLGLHSLLTWLD